MTFSLTTHSPAKPPSLSLESATTRSPLATSLHFLTSVTIPVNSYPGTTGTENLAGLTP